MITSPPTTVDTSGIDTGLLATLVIELNILRRNATAYPPGHPVVGGAAEKVAGLVRRLVESSGEITLGIARDILMLGNTPLDRKNPVYRDLARVLFDRGIVALTFRRHVEAEELVRFAGLLALRKEEIRVRGGIGKALAEAGVTRLEAREIAYDLFRVTEEERIVPGAQAEGGPPPVWEQFVSGLLDGTLDPFGAVAGRTHELDPELLAMVMNGSLRENAAGRDESYAAVIASFLRRAEREQEDEESRHYAERFSTLVERLNPELRRQFLGSAFSALADHPAVAERVIPTLSDEAVLEALGEMNDRNATVPPLIVGLCRRLATGQPSREEAPPLSLAAAAEMGAKLGTIFRQGNSDQFVPEEYRGNLREIVASGTVAGTGLAEAPHLRGLIAGQNLEAKVGAIIVEILQADAGPQGDEVMGERLAELCAWHLESGDFGALRKICDRLPAPGSDTPPTPLQERLLAVAGAPAFVGALIDAPAVWGKERYGDIRAIVSRIGSPCVPVLLDRLALEQSMSLRRYFMECLVSLGTAARDGAVAALGDNRWYFVRNLVAVLRVLGDPAALRPLRRLLAHPHPRVRQETLRSLVHFRDPEGERMLLRELGSGNREALLNAIQLADRSRSPEVRERLLALLRRGGLGGPDFDVRCAVVRALAETGDETALPEMARQLRGKSLLRSAPLTRLKVEIVRSLARYPAAAALPLLHEAAASGVPEVARAARETMRGFVGRSQ